MCRQKIGQTRVNTKQKGFPVLVLSSGMTKNPGHREPGTYNESSHMLCCDQPGHVGKVY